MGGCADAFAVQAGVSYEIVEEMDEINHSFAETGRPGLVRAMQRISSIFKFVASGDSP